MRLSVLIVQFGAADLLSRCVASLDGELPADAELIVVNNDRPDAIPAVVRRGSAGRLPCGTPVRLLQQDRNLGFAAGCNLGVGACRGEWIFFLNNDAVVEPGAVAALLRAAERHPKHEIFQSRVRSLREPGRFDYAGAAGGMLDRYGYPFCRGRLFDTLEEDRGQYDDAVEIFWASGAAMLARRRLLESLGGFDEDFFTYMEEIDFCWRARLRGVRALFVPDSVVRHQGATALAREGFRSLYLNHRNNLLMVLRNAPAADLILRLGLEAASAAAAVLSGRFRRCAAILAASGSLAGQPLRVWRKRRAEARARRAGGLHVRRIAYPGSVAVQYFLMRRRTVQEIANFRTMPAEEVRPARA